MSVVLKKGKKKKILQNFKEWGLEAEDTVGNLRTKI